MSPQDIVLVFYCNDSGRVRNLPGDACAFLTQYEPPFSMQYEDTSVFYARRLGNMARLQVYRDVVWL